MGRSRLWTKETVLAEALKYKTPYEFQKANKKAYSFAHRFHLLKEVTAHMERITSWTLESLQAEALKYTNRSDFYRRSKKAYGVAWKRGVIDEICSHMGKPWPTNWIPENVYAEALKYETRSEFQDNARMAYERARIDGYLDQACSHMKKVSSLAENTLLTYLQSLNPEFKRQRFGNKYELDCYSESLKLGVEHNGLYWHHEEALKRVNQDPIKYHLSKTKYFEAMGIRIIHIWEHEWQTRPEQVKDFLKSACRLNTIRIGARKCEFKEITFKECREFLNKTHIQGAPPNAVFSLGCFYEDKLIGVCAFGKHHRKAEQFVLNRFACLPDYTVSGFLSKASKFAFTKLQKPLISWADYSKSQANGYLNAGWKIEEVLRPDYFYYQLQTKKVISKQSRKKSCVNTPEGMTERQHAEKDGLVRIYDCGKIRLSYS